jgi:trehalose synthase
MLHRIDFDPVPFEPYTELLESSLTEELRNLVAHLDGARVVHVNSTAVGGGVAEILRSLIPISKGLGLDTDWYVISPPAEFFDVTKKIHNLMQGAEGALTPEEMQTYTTYAGKGASLDPSPIDADVWILHDPQLLPLMALLTEGDYPPIVWVCHIDLSEPNQGMLASVFDNIRRADVKVFSLKQYVPAGLEDAAVHIIPPAIDPLSVKNRPMEMEDARRRMGSMGIDLDRPLVTQVSRFDPWKDPWGVVEAYKLVKERMPNVQLAYLGASHAVDDPEGNVIFEEISEQTKDDPDIHLFGDADIPIESVDLVVSAFQTASDVLLQKSVREGFGLTVTEGMWKGQPVIGGNVGGIRLQISDGESGFLVDDVPQCAQRILRLLEEPVLRTTMGEAARSSVRHRFLLPRLLRDYLRACEEARAHRALGASSSDACGT